MITGATKGLGRDFALSLAGAGCEIAATGRNQEELDSLRSEITSAGGRCEIRRADLCSSTEILEMAGDLDRRMGPFDVLINNAGTTSLQPVLDIDPEQWDVVLNVNLRAPALLTSVIAKGMKERRRGSIINIASAASVVAMEEHAAYCASKFGLIGLTKVMAVELGPSNIRVNAVCPTVVLTDMGTKVWGDPAKSEPMLEKIPLHRFAQPSDITDTVMFLASDASAMINGAVLLLDGGYTAQ
jgi:NAD(P)-dependent dehydrogenase (short-subunit alcohol dehydrogenase family)